MRPDTAPLHDLGRTAKEAARYLEAENEAALDPKTLGDRLDAVGRDRKLSDTARRTAALAIFKEAEAAAMALAQTRLEAGTPGVGVARGLSAARDVIVDMVYRFARAYGVHPESATQAEAMGIAAVGGYGRGSLAPYSDIDLLIILPYKRTAWVESIAEYMLYMLWDLGLKVGYATRSLDECIRLGREDMTIRTTLLESRYVTGSREIVDSLKERFWAEIAEGTGAEFITAKLDERNERHRRAGNSRYLVEPNLKDGKGGLRDLHTLYWIAKYLYGTQSTSDFVDTGLLTATEFNAFKRAEAFLWDVRCHLHFAAGRAEERLTFDRQQELAARMGYKDLPNAPAVEAFMKNYFLIAKDVGDLTRIICAGLELRQQKRAPALTRLIESFQARGLDAPGFTLTHGRVDVENDQVFTADPVNLLRMFYIADQKDLLIHPNALRLVTRSLHLVDAGLRANDEANRLFIDMLTSPRDPERILRRMNEAGVLGLFVPDFGRIVARMQFNMYHHYTVDEHLIRAVAELAALERGDLDKEYPKARKVMNRVDDRVTLYLAVLCHDIAKGRPEDHSTAGAQVAEELGPRFGLTKAQTSNVAWLVRYHLVMSMVAQKRDITDPKTINDFAKIVQSAERLRLLYLLTICDIRAVGPGTWNAWKGQLLENLYEETLLALPGGAGREGRATRIQDAQDALYAALRHWKEEAREHAIARQADGYWLSTDAATQVRHAHLLRDADKLLETGTPVFAYAAEPNAERGATEITVIAQDRPGLFAALTGALAAAGANVLESKITTTKDGLALDVFVVQGMDGLPIDDKRALGRLKDHVSRATFDEYATKVPRAKLKKRERVFDVEATVSINYDASETYTVIEVNARDRRGLLHDVAQAFADMRLSVGSAHISTFGEAAVDVFYVRDRFGLKLKRAPHKALRQALLDAAG